MPELPEVEAARRAIEVHCVGKKIRRAVIAEDDKVIVDVSPTDFEASIFGKVIIAAHRKGKNMWLELDSPPYPSFQFGMAGAIYIKGVAVTKYKRSAVKDSDEWPSKYSKFFIELDDGVELSFTDKRRFARVRLLKNPATVPPISELGPDALLDPMTVDDFTNSLSKIKKDIKTVILDQKFISGIGNWIADEVLYQARIHPLQKASSLSNDSCKTLHNCIKEVIDKAVEVGADSSEFPVNWIFHSREKKPDKAFVDGKKIEFIAAGGRTTAFVPELQKLVGIQASEVVVTRKSGKKTDKGSKDVEDDGNLAEQSEEDKNGKTLKSKGKKKNMTRNAGKKAPAKGKMNNEDEDEDEDEDEEDGDDDKEKKKKKPLTKRPAKRKRKDSEDEDEAEDEDGSEYSGEEKKQKTKRVNQGSKKKLGK